MVKRYILYTEGETSYILDIPGRIYGEGSTPKLALEDALCNGVPANEVAL